MAASFLEIALGCIARGWRVHPLKPDTKVPLTPHGWKDASGNEGQVNEWWTASPDANVGIACGPSGLCVLDCDHGLNSEEEFYAWRDKCGLPETYTVRTGRRDSFGVQLYFRGSVPTATWDNWNGCSGDIKSLGGYVLGAGSNHPVTGEKYTVLCNLAIAPTPEMVRALRSSKPETGKADEPITENRNIRLTSIAGKLREAGLSPDALEAALLQVNADRCEPPLEEEEVRWIAEHVSKYPLPEPVGTVTIGKSAAPAEPVDWRTHYHTVEAHDSVGPPEFLIDGFLQRQAIMGVGAFIGQKKTLLALNIAWSLCSGEPLFGKYKVTRHPTRVLYLGPENGMISFANRVNQIGLREYLGKTFFYTTMSMPEKLPLTALAHEEVLGAVVFISTAIRYTEGSENDATQMKAFAELAFALIRDGAECVIVLHHSPKAMTKANELTLENSFRGTGELSAFLSVALAMRTQDMNDEYNSASLIRFVKQRDFEPKSGIVGNHPPRDVPYDFCRWQSWRNRLKKDYGRSRWE